MDPEGSGRVGFSAFVAACLAARPADEARSRVAFGWIDRRKKDAISAADVEMVTGKVRCVRVTVTVAGACGKSTDGGRTACVHCVVCGVVVFLAYDRSKSSAVRQGTTPITREHHPMPPPPAPAPVPMCVVKV